ncbi:MAG: hypothetical protein R3B89_25760 [Polyangiaceae bacterium]
MVFQPIINLDDGELFAYEALVRRSAPSSATPACCFSTRAVDTGCSGRLGRMIREIAVPRWQWIPLFVNAHPSELNESWLVRPDDPIFMHDHEIYVEITESVPMTHFRPVPQRAQRGALARWDPPGR